MIPLGTALAMLAAAWAATLGRAETQDRPRLGSVYAHGGTVDVHHPDGSPVSAVQRKTWGEVRHLDRVVPTKDAEKATISLRWGSSKWSIAPKASVTVPEGHGCLVALEWRGKPPHPVILTKLTKEPAKVYEPEPRLACVLLSPELLAGLLGAGDPPVVEVTVLADEVICTWDQLPGQEQTVSALQRFVLPADAAAMPAPQPATDQDLADALAVARSFLEWLPPEDVNWLWGGLTGIIGEDLPDNDALASAARALRPGAEMSGDEWRQAGLTLAAAGLYREAGHALARAQETVGRDSVAMADLKRAMAGLTYQLGDDGQAADLLRESIANQPTSQAEAALAWLLAWQGEATTAREHLARADELRRLRPASDPGIPELVMGDLGRWVAGCGCGQKPQAQGSGAPPGRLPATEPGPGRPIGPLGPTGPRLAPGRGQSPEAG